MTPIAKSISRTIKYNITRLISITRIPNELQGLDSTRIIKAAMIIKGIKLLNLLFIVNHISVTQVQSQQ